MTTKKCTICGKEFNTKQIVFVHHLGLVCYWCEVERYSELLRELLHTLQEKK